MERYFTIRECINKVNVLMESGSQTYNIRIYYVNRKIHSLRRKEILLNKNNYLYTH
jgi:hypothetical protein